MHESDFSPESGAEREPTVEEVVAKAVEAGYLEVGDLDYSNEDDFDDVLTQVTMYIEQSGDDSEEVLRKWGVIE